MRRGKAAACALAAVTGALILSLAGCSATIKCPRETQNPRSVFLINHGRHNTIAIHGEDGRIYRYGYGDQRYYGHTKTGFRSATRALLWPTPAALGRQSYDVAKATRQAVTGAVKVPVREVYQFSVSTQAVDALQEHLDNFFKQSPPRELWTNPRSDFDFAPHPRYYWLWHNSNHRIAAWFESLGCETQGLVTFSTGMSGAEK